MLKLQPKKMKSNFSTAKKTKQVYMMKWDNTPPPPISAGAATGVTLQLISKKV